MHIAAELQKAVLASCARIRGANAGPYDEDSLSPLCVCSEEIVA